MAVSEIWDKSKQLNAKWERYLNQEQKADLFARENMVDNEDFMYDMWYYWFDPYAIGKANKMPVKQVVLKMCDINFGSTEWRHSKKMTELRYKILKTYKLDEYIDIYNRK